MFMRQNKFPILWKSLFHLIGIAIIACTFIDCANRMPPPGGPVNRTPPAIISTLPANGSTNFMGSRIRIEFNQYVDERSVEESIFISPYVGQLEFKWHGKKVDIVFEDTLRSNITYVVTVGTDVTGYYTKTRMAQSFTLAFSTGSEINQGALSGSIIPRNENDTKSGVMIFAYRIDSFSKDTLNPARHSPDFITQTGVKGEFSFVHLPWGMVRLFAIRDEYRNLLYDCGVDDFGVCMQDYNLSESDSSFSNIIMQLAREDTTAPILIKVNPINNKKVDASFSESLHPRSLDVNNFSILDTTTNALLKVNSIYPSTSNKTSVMINTEEQDSLSRYRLTVNGVRDSAGNVISPKGNSLVFSGSSIPDSLRFQLESVSIKDSTLGVPLHPSFHFTFSDAVDTAHCGEWLRLRADSASFVPLIVHWQTLTTSTAQPVDPLIGLHWYSLEAELFKIKRWDSVSLEDSLKQWRFQTLDSYELGSVSGSVTLKSHNQPVGTLYVISIPVEKSIERSTAVVDKTGTFSFPMLQAGKYVLKVFEDTNRNGVYDPGKPFPFQPSEPVFLFNDTLRIRARWPLEGVNLNLPF